jgi:hypothetical protein
MWLSIPMAAASFRAATISSCATTSAGVSILVMVSFF